MNASHSCNRESENSASLEKLLTEKDYAQITGRSVASARRDRLMGRGCTFVKLGHLVRYRPQDIRTFIDSNLRGGNAREVA